MKTITATITSLGPKESLKEMHDRLHPVSSGLVNTFHHGITNKSCFICDSRIEEEITGKRVEYRVEGIRHTDIICINCFVEPEYWEGKEIIGVTNF